MLLFLTACLPMAGQTPLVDIHFNEGGAINTGSESTQQPVASPTGNQCTIENQGMYWGRTQGNTNSFWYQMYDADDNVGKAFASNCTWEVLFKFNEVRTTYKSTTGDTNVTTKFISGQEDGGWVFYLNTGKLCFQYVLTTGTATLSTNIIPKAGKFYHAVVTLDKSTGAMKFYLNGQQKATATANTAYAFKYPNVGTTKRSKGLWYCIGGDTGPNVNTCQNPANMECGFVRIYGSTLTADQAAALYAAADTKGLTTAPRTFSVIGNSISTYQGYVPDGFAVYGNYNPSSDLKSVDDTWWMQFGKMSGMQYWANASWSGSCVANVESTTSCFTNDARIAALAKGGVAPDLVIIAGGVNDWWRPGTEGRVLLGDFNTTDPSTFRGAYTLLVQKIQTAYPNAKIVGMSILPNRISLTQNNSKGWSMADGNASIKKIVEDAGGYYVDLTHCGLEKDIAGNTIDGLHPNRTGMRYVASGLCKSLVQQDLVKGATGLQNAPNVEGDGGYFYMHTTTSDAFNKRYIKAADISTSTLTGRGLGYHGSDGTPLADADKKNPEYIFHVYSRGGNNQSMIKNCGNKGATYLEMNAKGNVWSQVALKPCPVSNGSAFNFAFGKNPFAYHIKATGASTYYWRKGGDANGITTSDIKADDLYANDFYFEPIDEALIPYAKYCEEVNTCYAFEKGNAPGKIAENKWEAFRTFLDGQDLTYNSSTDYETLLTAVQETREASMAPINGVYTIKFADNNTYFLPLEDGTLGYTATMDATNPQSYFQLTPETSGNYTMKNMGNENGYLRNSNVGDYVRTTNIYMEESKQQEQALKLIVPGYYRMYAVGDYFGYNRGQARVTTYNSNSPCDVLAIEEAQAVLLTVGEAGYATLYSDKNLTIPTGVKGILCR